MNDFFFLQKREIKDQSKMQASDWMFVITCLKSTNDFETF